MRFRVLANLIFFGAVFALMLSWAAANLISVRQIDRPYRLTGSFVATSGILPAAEVAYLGVHFGAVTSVERLPGGAGSPCGTDPATNQARTGCVRITMDIDRGKQIPLHSVARIFRKSAIGEPYIDFQPPASYDPAKATARDYYVNNGSVPIEETQNPLEFDELLKTASALLANIDPAKAGDLIHQLALALNGRTQDLRNLTTSLDDLTATFAAKTNVLDRLATNNTAIVHVLADHANDLGQSLTNLREVSDTLAAAKGDTQVLLEQGSQLLGHLADLVSDEKSNLDCTLHDLADVNMAAGSPEQIDTLNQLLTVGPQGFSTLAKTIDHLDDGPWARVNLITNPVNPAKQYSPPLALPASPAVPACASTVPTGRGPDFAPSDVVSSSGGLAVLPATGGVALIGVAAALVAAALGFRRVVRRAHDR